MKNGLLMIFIGLFVMLMTDAQQSQPQLNQNELMKKFLGSWYTEGTYLSSELREFGASALEGYQKTEYKDSVLAYYQLIFGYDRANDRYILAGISKIGNEVILRSYKFISENFCESTPLENTGIADHLQKATYEFISPDLIVGTFKDRNNQDRVYRMIRGKKPV